MNTGSGTAGGSVHVSVDPSAWIQDIIDAFNGKKVGNAGTGGGDTSLTVNQVVNVQQAVDQAAQSGPIIGKTDLSDEYINGWKDKSKYQIIEITADGRYIIKSHTSVCGGDKEYGYFLDPEKMEYHFKEDFSDWGTTITIENGVLTEKTSNFIMVYRLTDELG